MKLNKIQFVGALSASEKGLEVTEGFAIIPTIESR
jgi:hypothetical protein